MQKKKLNVLLLIAFLLGLAYMLYSMSYVVGGRVGDSSGTEQAGAAIAAMLVGPHLVVTFVAVVFNGLGLFFKEEGLRVGGRHSL